MKAVKKSSSLQFRKHLPIILAIVFGFFAAHAVNYALAHGGDTDMVHACVKNSNGSVRIVGENDTCGNGESPLDWPRTASSGGNSALICPFCRSVDILERTNFNDLSGENFDLANLTTSYIENQDFSGSSFVGAVLFQIQAEGTNFSNADFSNANLQSAGLVNTNLTNANLTNAYLYAANLIGANMTNANITSVTWKDTWCPDGTNSEDNGETCEGHLTP